MDCQLRSLSEPTRAAAKVAASISHLVAVATLDWCEHAAACFVPVAPGGLVGVLIASVGADGSINSHEATGVAVDPARLPLAGTGHVTSVLDRLGSIGWDAASERVGLLGELPRSERWREGELGSAWSNASWTAAGVALVGSRTPGRSVLVYVASPEPVGRASTVAQAVLDATLPLLVDRTLMAIGEEPASAGTWLTAREQQVLEQLTLGRSVREIAEGFGRSPYTVHDHVKSLHRKLNASTRGELVARALGYREGDQIRETKPLGAARPIATGRDIQ